MVQEPQEEKKEFLRRDEIKTMAKDIARLREIEAQEEREKISSLDTGGEIKPATSAPGEQKPGENPEEVKKEISIGLMPKPPLFKATPRKKYLIRGGVIFVIISILGFSIWYFTSKKPPQAEIPAETPPIQQAPPEKPEIIIPASLISASGTISAEILRTDEIPEVLNLALEGTTTLGTFSRVLIKNVDQNRLISLGELTSSFLVGTPEGFLGKLESDFTLAVFSQKQGNRIAVVSKVKDKEGLNSLLKSWEKEISEKGVFISGNRVQAVSSSFKTAYVQKTGLRYLTISKDDLGVCYAWFGDYFVLTNSFDSIKEVIQQLTI